MRIWFSPLSRHLRCDCCLVSAAFLLAQEVSRGLVIRIAKKLKWNPGSFCRDRRERSEHAQEETKVSSVSCVIHQLHGGAVTTSCTLNLRLLSKEAFAPPSWISFGDSLGFTRTRLRVGLRVCGLRAEQTRNDGVFSTGTQLLSQESRWDIKRSVSGRRFSCGGRYRARA